MDEIRKCPALLDEVHALIEERGIRFLLTGSSAGKLRAADTNLLGGRARTRRMHPFSRVEVGGKGFDGIEIMPWRHFLDELWHDRVVS